jgi:hypothetical protein
MLKARLSKTEPMQKTAHLRFTKNRKNWVNQLIFGLKLKIQFLWMKIG